MTRTLRHRGPDEEGYHIRGSTGLGFQRLSVIDLAGGHQPMSNDDESLWIVFNGEIYNFRSLKQDLEKTGRHRFKTQSDTEVILHLYEEYGESCVSYLRGMFAFAIWDTRKESLFLARDRFGKKPLVYADLSDAFIFASEIKALLQHPSVPSTISYDALDSYLTYQYVPSPQTIFERIHKVPPAHTLVWHKGQVTLRRYWDLSFQPKTSLSFDDAKRQMMNTLREAIRLRMNADVPVGAFLSGGIDSSAIVALMSDVSTHPVKTFSIGFEEADYSELHYARLVAAHFKTDHHEMIVKAEMTETLPKLVQHYGEPFADASALPSYYLSKITRPFVTVALSGEGGDETLGGYMRYQTMRSLAWWDKLPSAARRLLQKIYNRLPYKGSHYGRANILLELGDSPAREAYGALVRIFRPSQKERLYSPFLKKQAQKSDAASYMRALLWRHPDYAEIDPYLYADLCSYIPECLMVKTDIASMANSLEVRSPFLDHHVVEMTASFPADWKMRGANDSKFILRKALETILPNPILTRRKQGFSVPIAHWFRDSLNSYLRSILLSPKSQSRDLFEKQYIEELFQEHENGRRDNSHRLYALLMLELWFKAFIDGER